MTLEDKDVILDKINKNIIYDCLRENNQTNYFLYCFDYSTSSTVVSNLEPLLSKTDTITTVKDKCSHSHKSDNLETIVITIEQLVEIKKYIQKELLKTDKTLKVKLKVKGESNNAHGTCIRGFYTVILSVSWSHQFKEKIRIQESEKGDGQFSFYPRLGLKVKVNTSNPMHVYNASSNKHTSEFNGFSGEIIAIDKSKWLMPFIVVKLYNVKNGENASRFYNKCWYPTKHADYKTDKIWINSQNVVLL